MARSKEPIRYTTQLGVVLSWSSVGAGDAGGGGNGGTGGCASVGSIAGVVAGDAASVGAEGVDFGAGSVTGTGTDGASGADVTIDAVGGDSMVKAPTALQALWVFELIALTFQ